MDFPDEAGRRGNIGGTGNLDVTFVDPEPPDAAGGGIRTYIRLALETCRGEGIPARVYTHNAADYPGENAIAIGRKPWIGRPWRSLAYRLCYHENVLREHARWLADELAAHDAPGKVYEFADFLGYAAFAVRNPALHPRLIVRVHAPHFLIAETPRGARARWEAGLAERRERESLARAQNIAAPSAEFLRECLPWVRNWTHVPNPLPPQCEPTPALAATRRALAEARDARELTAPAHADKDAPADRTGEWAVQSSDGWRAAAAAVNPIRPAASRLEPERFLYLGRVEERKGVLILVRAFLRLAPEFPLASLTLVGGAAAGAYAQSVGALVDSQPPEMRARLRWEPPCKPAQRAALFARFTTLAVPSLWENSPYVYFEAMAAGLHCIGSATGEMKAAARVTGALTARPGDEDDWLRVLRARCGGQAREALEAQQHYLRDRREDARRRLVESWRAAAR